MMCYRIIAFLPLLLFTACNHRVPTSTIELIDTSMSIAPQAEKAVLDAARDQIQRMRRGDRLILIPITGNAENDAGGRILRLRAPTKRESYDADLRRFREAAQKRFAAWAAARSAESSRTDILGSLDAARQEIAALPKGSNKRLIVLSDFLEDDGTYRFLSDADLADVARARALAARVRAEHGLEKEFAADEVTVCLGRLESTEFRSLPPVRQSAVDAFWSAYFADDGRVAEIHYDGIGMLGGSGRGCPSLRQ